MAFAQPIALFLFGLFIPVVLLYLLKQRRRRMLVSSLLFWERILREEQSVTSWTKLRKLLSLLLQLLFITLLVFALARPLLSKDLLGARRMVLLLDVSASMTVEEGEETRFDEAKVLARDVIRGMSLGDTLMLVAVGREADILVPFTDSRKTLLEALDTVAVTHSETRFEGGFELLRHLPPDERETCVYIVSDGAFDPISTEIPERTRFAYLPVGKAAENVGITAFQLRPLPGSPRDFEILLEAVNESESEQRVPFELRVENHLIDAGELVLPPGEPLVRTVKQFSRGGGQVTVTLDHEDAFNLDNRAFAVLPEPAPISVALVTEGNLFLESALITDDEIALETVTPSTYAESSIHADVTIFDKWAPEHAPEGHCIFIGAWPVELGALGEKMAENPIITDWERDHPVMRHLHLTNVSIHEALQLKPAEGFETLIESFAHPLAAYRASEEGAALVVAFDTTSSNLPLRVAFPILIGNTVRHMVGADEAVAWQGPDIGNLLSRDDARAYLGRQEDERVEVLSILKPGEEPREEEGTSTEALLAVDRAGVYRYRDASGEWAPLFAANMVNRRESRIAPTNNLPVETDEPLPEVTGGFRLGSEPWFLLAFLAFVLLAAEWVLFHRRIVE